MISFIANSVGSPVMIFLAGLSLAMLQGDVAMTAGEAKPIKVGSTVPKVDIFTTKGEKTSLAKVLNSEPTVLVFYRGGWCPFCNRHLGDLGSVEGDLKGMGFQLIAITPDTPAELNKTIDKDKLTFQIFSDSKADVLKKFGVAFRVDDATFTTYRDKYHLDLEKASGETHHILPVPSVFIINSKGKITYVNSNPDYRVRLKGAEVLEAAKSSM